MAIAVVMSVLMVFVLLAVLDSRRMNRKLRRRPARHHEYGAGGTATGQGGG